MARISAPRRRRRRLLPILLLIAAVLVVGGLLTAVMPHSRGSSSPRSASAQPKVEEKESFGESSGLVRWLRSMDDTA